MLRRGAGLSEVAELMSTMSMGGKTILRELTQSYIDMYTAQEQKVPVVGGLGRGSGSVPAMPAMPVTLPLLLRS
jgi:hypothetical protein